LSKDGEQIIFGHADGTIIDMIEYGPQTENIPSARVPNGTGEFINQTPTFNGNNDLTTNVNQELSASFNVFPNPAKNQINIQVLGELIGQPLKVSLKNIMGQSLAIQAVNDQPFVRLNVRSVPTGIYLLELTINGEQKVVQKIMIHH